MGFRKDAYATVWSAESISDTITKLQISVSRKDKAGEYVTDFSGFVTVYGTSSAQKAAMLSKGDRIKLGDIDVSTTYNKETHQLYTNFKCFSFERADNGTGSTESSQKKKAPDDGEPEINEDSLPF